MIVEIDAEELARRLTAGDITLIDVREDDEVAVVRIHGARHIPMGEVPDRLDDLATMPAPHVICHAGGRSLRVCEFLAHNGIDAVNVRGGMLGWVDAGLDVETSSA